MSEGNVRWSCKCGKHPETDCADFLQCEEKILYQDGIRVYKEELTLDELKKWYPTIHARKLGPPDILCPVCGKAFAHNAWRGLVTHCRLMHPDWYAEERDAITGAASAGEYLKAYADKRTVDHVVAGSPA